MANNSAFATEYQVLTPQQRLIRRENIEKVIYDSLIENDIFTYI
jgi:hypothetical protein